MCIIAIKPKGKKMFTAEQINTMFANNPHGCGYMYYDYKTKKVVIRKGFMSNRALMKDLGKKDLTNTNVILHFRISTSGLIDALNCHPYPIYDKNKVMCSTDIALAHNGVLRAYEPSKYSKINDTQVFINSVLKPLKKGWESDNDKLSLIKNIIGNNNKLAILNNENKVVMIGDFVEDNGYYYSNTSYMKHNYSYYCGSYLPLYDYELYDEEDEEEAEETGKKDNKTHNYVSTKAKKSHKDQVIEHDEFGSSDFWNWWDEKHPIKS